ncbi:MAG: BspA family leucine-rich repeat surface protein [bacterium]
MNCWDVSSITNMSQLFTYYYNWFTFNEPIGGWNVSKFTDMSAIFILSTFNQDASN